jgi:hypothetical protein
MAKSFKYFLNKFSAYQKAQKAKQKPIVDTDLSALKQQLEALTHTLTMLLLQKEMESIKGSLGKVLPQKPEASGDHTSEVSDLSRKESLDNLEKVATNRKDKSGKREFLLHRPTVDHEYEKSIQEGGQFQTTEKTEWFVEYVSGEKRQDSFNAVVSAWIPEDAVSEIPHPYLAADTWSGLGKNPNACKYTAIVAPGKYKIYGELKS